MTVNEEVDIIVATEIKEQLAVLGEYKDTIGMDREAIVDLRFVGATLGIASVKRRALKANSVQRTEPGIPLRSVRGIVEDISVFKARGLGIGSVGLCTVFLKQAEFGQFRNHHVIGNICGSTVCIGVLSHSIRCA